MKFERLSGKRAYRCEGCKEWIEKGAEHLVAATSFGGRTVRVQFHDAGCVVKWRQGGKK